MTTLYQLVEIKENTPTEKYHTYNTPVALGNQQLSALPRARYCFRYHAHILSHMLQSKYHSYFADEGVMEAK